MRLRFVAPLAALAGVLITQVASAQQKDGEFTVQRFFPAPGPRNFITVEGARTDGKMAFSLGLFGSYGNDPFLLKTCESTTTDCSGDATKLREIHLVETLITADLLASLTVIPRVQLGLRLPFTFVHGAGINTDPNDPARGQQTRTGLSGSGFGDPMFEAKIRAFGDPTDTYVIGLSFFGTAPVAHNVSSTEDKYIGDLSPTLGGRAIYDGQAGRFNFGLNLGGAYRKEGSLGSAQMGSEFRYGVAGGFEVSPVLTLIAEIFGASRLSTANGTNALEGALAARLRPLNSDVALTAGAGLGISDGVGVPSVRAFAGLAFIADRNDQDGDGIIDDRDQCPTAAEDVDGFQDEDGCPDPDNDGDGIVDGKDKCVNEPETKNGFQDEDGCPDEIPDRDKDGIIDAEDKCPDDGGSTVIHRLGEFYGCPDHDKDGVPDKIDKCPDDPEDTDGFQDADGCPDPDNDGDKIPDPDDQCVDLPEIVNGYQDDDGCPDEVPDRDHDGIPDAKDKCPDAPETYNGYQDDDGCPDKGNALVEVGADDIKIKDVVNFAPDSDKIVGKRSFVVLDAVASAIVHHPELFKIEVGGHTDDKGDAAHNKDLSKRRAGAVVDYLASKGVDSRRLSSQGYGPDKPIADNRTGPGRAKNRRVEFKIVASLKKPAPAAAQ